MKANRKYQTKCTLEFKELLRNVKELIILGRIPEGMEQVNSINCQSDLKRRGNDMVTEEPRYCDLAENASDLIYRLDAGGTFTFATSDFGANDWIYQVILLDGNPTI